MESDGPLVIMAVGEAVTVQDDQCVPVIQDDPDIRQGRSFPMSKARGDQMMTSAQESQAAVLNTGEVVDRSSTTPSDSPQSSHHLDASKSRQGQLSAKRRDGQVPTTCDPVQGLPLAEQSTNERAAIRPLPWVASYDKVEEAVREYEIQTTSAFLVAMPDRDFGKAFDECKHRHHIHLDSEGFGSVQSPRLSLAGIPYIMMGNRRLICHHGKPHPNSSRKVCSGKHRQSNQASKKVGCPSHIIIRHVILLPDFKFDVAVMTMHRRRELSKFIKAKWREKDVSTESRFYLEFPEASSHRNHPLGEADGVRQPIDKRVNERMLSLIGDGVRSVPAIERAIGDFVRDELFRGSPCPAGSNRRFYPTQKDIANRVFKFSLASSPQPTARLHRGEVKTLATRLAEESEGRDLVQFRESALGVRGCRIDSRTDLLSAGERNEGLFFIYQSQHQQKLLVRYGNALTFLDPAHRVTGYPLPLYLLLVPTNCDCHVVAVVALERDSPSDLQEALGVIREANPDWKPRQLLIDGSEVERNVLHTLFSDSRVFLSDVRRQEAWDQWLASQGNGVAAQQTRPLRAAMESVALARSQEKHQAALVGLEGLWSHPDLERTRAWFQGEWMPTVQRWAHVCRQPEQIWPLLLNRGMERQREAMGYPYIVGNNHLPLHKVLKLLIQDVFPEMWARYVHTNETWLSLSSPALPTWLHHRPLPFVEHCQQGLALLGKVPRPSIEQMALNTYQVLGYPADSVSQVDASGAICSCEEFSNTGYPCLHLMTCIASKDGDGIVNWQRLPSAYLACPLLAVDGEVGGVGGPMGGTGDGPHPLREDSADNDDSPAHVSDLQNEEEATSSLEAILAAVEAQSVTETTDHLTSDPGVMTPDDPTPEPGSEASRCQAVARELLALSHVVMDAAALAHARRQMESALALLRDAMPERELPVCPQEIPGAVAGAHLVDTPGGHAYRLPPARRLPHAPTSPASCVHTSDQPPIAIIGAETSVEVYEEDPKNGNESIVTETIDLQQGAVFILETSDVIQNFDMTEAPPLTQAIGSAILKG